MTEAKKTALAERLRVLRRERKLTQRAAAGRLNISRSCLANYETGSRQPDAETLAALARFYNASADYILALSDERNPNLLDKSALLRYLEKTKAEELRKLTPAAEYKIMDYVEYILSVEGRNRQEA
jgi:transcriptional regulator with XRE-family HTH domain